MKLGYLIERRLDEDDDEDMLSFDELYEFSLKEPSRWQNYKTIVWDFIDEN